MPRKRTTQPKSTTATKGRTANRTAKPNETGRPSRKAGPKARPPTKLQVCLDLLYRKHGATLDELMVATGWQAHSVRGFVSGTVKKKFGLSVDSIKDECGVRRYRLDRQRGVAV